MTEKIINTIVFEYQKAMEAIAAKFTHAAETRGNVSPELMKKFSEQFKHPEKFARIAGEIIAVKQPATNEHREKPMMHHSGPDL